MNLMVDTDRMWPGHWFGFNALCLSQCFDTVGLLQEKHLAHKKTHSTYRQSFGGTVGEIKQRGTVFPC